MTSETIQSTTETDMKIYEKPEYGPITRIYDERKDFIIIGLTGRTGSGCTMVSSILNKEFKDLELKTPKITNFENSEERKYGVLYKYAKENWKDNKFTTIEMSNIIASFLYEEGYKKFEDFVKTKNNSKSLLNEIEGFKEKFEHLHREIKKIDFADGYENFFALFYSEIPEFTKELKDILKKHQYNDDSKGKNETSQLYTHIFQIFGSNIRASGNPYDNKFDIEKIFVISERVNNIIKAIRKINKNANKKTLICINAIRNKYEATFLKDRYSSFYLFSVNTEEEYRKRRLNNLNKYEIDSLDKIEYDKSEKLEEQFYTQNIKSCSEIADIHIHNPDFDDNTFYYLTEQIIKYVTLIMHPGLVTPTHIERCMQVAFDAKLNSGCLSRQVGAVVTDANYSIKSIGWNSVPEGQIQCNLRDLENLCINKDAQTYSHYEITDSKFKLFASTLCNQIQYDRLIGRFHPYCFKDCYNALENKPNQVHTRSLHAEENAFLQISKYGGQGVKGGFLFTTASPCELCAKKAYQLGMVKIYYIDPYPGISKKHILKFGAKGDPEMILFHGAIGAAYTMLYSQRISFKDELSLLTKIGKEELLAIAGTNKEDVVHLKERIKLLEKENNLLKRK